MSLYSKFKSYLINEINLSRLYQHTQNATIGIISAERAEADKTTNNNNTAKLERLIRSAGFGYVRIKGNFIENYGTPEARKVSENSFLVISSKDDNGKLKGFLKKTAATISHPPQDSVLYKDANEKAILIGTSPTNSYPSVGKELTIGDWKPNKLGQFYSSMRRHKSFTFESLHYPQAYPSLLMTLKYMPEEEKRKIYTTHFDNEE